jgi:hypothetical protein
VLQRHLRPAIIRGVATLALHARLFPKLGISSRARLRSMLSAD